MALLILTSENPEFSYILQKNPSSPPIERDLRKGKVRGWFDGPNKYYVRFTDAPDDISFAHVKTEFEYLDRTRYCNPFAVVQMINTVLRSAFQGGEEAPFPCSAKTVIELERSNYTKRLAKELGVTLQVLFGNIVEVTIEGTTVATVLQKLGLFCFVNVLCTSEDTIFIDKSLMLKYALVAQKLDISFYAKYMFLRQVQSPNDFKEFQEILQKDGELFCFGNTRSQRFSVVKDILTGGSTLYDFGCGELYQATKLAKKYEVVFGIDKDPLVQAENVHRIARKKLENVTLLETFPEVLEEGSDVLAGEVLEHMELIEAKNVLSFLASQPFKNLVITTPNREFNSFYALDGLRHDDHKWEPNLEEFTNLVEEFFPNLHKTIKGIGDSVRGVHTSLFAHIRKS